MRPNMVSNKLRARTASKGSPYICKVIKIIMPPPPPPPPPPPDPWDPSMPIFLQIHMHYLLGPSLADVDVHVCLPVYAYNQWYKFFDFPLYTFSAYVVYNDWDGIFTIQYMVVWKTGAAVAETCYAGPHFPPPGFLLDIYGWNPLYDFFTYQGQLASYAI